MKEPDRFATHADLAAALLLKPKVTAADREKAAELLLSGCGGVLRKRLVFRWRFSEQDAEELVTDIVMAFIADPPRNGHAQAWLSNLLKYKAKDALRHDGAQMRDPGAPVLSIDKPLGDDEGPLIDPAVPDDVAPRVALRDCLSHGLKRMEQESPTYVVVLGMVAEGLSIEEIAASLKVAYSAAKDRVFRAREAARRYFADCKE